LNTLRLNLQTCLRTQHLPQVYGITMLNVLQLKTSSFYNFCSKICVCSLLSYFRLAVIRGDMVAWWSSYWWYLQEDLSHGKSKNKMKFEHLSTADLNTELECQVSNTTTRSPSSPAFIFLSSVSWVGFGNIGIQKSCFLKVI
jgi:hypothetical protein